mmetsp:Transcript_27345/g.52048  ORF Transcript_27345/g.52048 Transcript_27345/m.52048 type:complete len:226 (+) Transcript_27345:564-1241(+)
MNSFLSNHRHRMAPSKVQKIAIIDSRRVRVVFPCLPRGCMVFHGAILEVNCHIATIGSSCGCGNVVHLLTQPLEGGVREGAVGASDRHLGGDDVVGGARVNVRHRHHPRVQRVQPSRHDGLQSLHHRGGCHDGVRGLVGGGGVTAAADHRHVKRPRCRQHRAFIGREVAQLEAVASEAGGDVQGEDGACLPQRTLLAHAPTPGTALLRRLENQAHRALQARLALL